MPQNTLPLTGSYADTFRALVTNRRRHVTQALAR